MNQPNRNLSDRTNLVSIVAPFFNEEDLVRAFYMNLSDAVSGIKGIAFEFVFVNDGSTDSTGAELFELTVADARVRVINLSRNFGHQEALWAGLSESIGDAVITIDSDLQDPPSLIPVLVERWLAGYEVVVAKRSSRVSDTRLKRWSAALFYVILEKLSDYEYPRQVGDYRLMTRTVVQHLLAIGSGARFTRGHVNWLGFNREEISFERMERIAGESKYTWRRMFSLARSGIVTSSTGPLTISFVFASLIAMIAGLYACVILIVKVLSPSTGVPGYSSLILVILVLGAMQFVVIGLIGMYVGEIMQNTRGRPPYIVSSVSKGNSIDEQ